MLTIVFTVMQMTYVQLAIRDLLRPLKPTVVVKVRKISALFRTSVSPAVSITVSIVIKMTSVPSATLALQKSVRQIAVVPPIKVSADRPFNAFHVPSPTASSVTWQMSVLFVIRDSP